MTKSLVNFLNTIELKEDELKKDTKCEKCKTSDAVVYFAVVSPKNRTSRKQYCKACALIERLKLTPQTPKETDNLSAIELVQKEMEKPSNPETNVENRKAASQSNNIDSLKKAMQVAIAKEDYEKAAKIRDQIASIKKLNG